MHKIVEVEHIPTALQPRHNKRQLRNRKFRVYTITNPALPGFLTLATR